jgi:hypothetical protein
MRASADLRLLRAAVFAAACAALAAAGHLAVAGPGIALWALAAGWAAVFAVAAPLAGRERRSAPALAAALAMGQLALHCLYCLGQHSPHAPHGDGSGDGGSGGNGVLAQVARLLCNDHAATLTEPEARHIVTAAGLDPATGGGHHATATPPPPPAADGLAGHLADAVASLGSAPMLLGHLLAATAAAWLLRRGEAALWRLVRLSTRAVAETAQALAFLLTALRRALRLADRTPTSYEAVARPHRHARLGAPAVTGTVLPHDLTRRGPPPGRLTLQLTTRHEQHERHEHLILAA